MNHNRSWLALPAILALGLTACSSGGSGDASSSSSSSSDASATAASTGIVTANSTEPQNPLIPANTNEVGGGRVLDLIFAGLVYYDADGATHNDMAESITTDDSITWTVKIKSGQKFTDGTDVKSENFVNAWKQGASQALLNASFYAPIEGADDEGSGDLTGLTIVDDTTFTIKLKQAESDFSARLGHASFYPLPDSTLADNTTGGENPVGNGPYKFASDSAWEHNVKLSLVPNTDYQGDRQAQNGGVDFVFYTSFESAYQDVLSDNLDVLDTLPDSAFSTYQTDLPDRNVNQPAAIFQGIAIPETIEHFSGEEGKLRRQAVSYAIDRDQITSTIFEGTRTPATDFTSPVVDGYNDSIEGNEVLTYDADKAKELWAQADAISPWSGTFTIGYNSDGSHQAWVDAVANSIKNTLGIDAQGNPYPDFKSLRDDVTNHKITGAFRSGWQADYPGLYNFLAPNFQTGSSGSDDIQYSNSQFDDLMDQAAAATSTEDANKLMDQAQQILFQDLPTIPLWYQNAVGGWSTKVSDVTFGWNSVPLYYQITKQG